MKPGDTLVEILSKEGAEEHDFFAMTSSGIYRLEFDGLEAVESTPEGAFPIDQTANVIPSPIQKVHVFEDPMDGLFIVLANGWGICVCLEYIPTEERSCRWIHIFNPRECAAALDLRRE